MIGTWRTLDKKPHFLTFKFLDSIHIALIQFGDQYPESLTYVIDTLNGYNIIKIKGKYPDGRQASDSFYIRMISSDTLKIHGRFSDNPIKGIITEDQWNDKNTLRFKTGTLLLKEKS